MQRAIEFIGRPHDNVVDLPAELQGWNGRRVRVILLDAELEVGTTRPGFDAIKIKTREFRFDRDEANAR